MKLYLVGGFLGSGKTTAIATAARVLLKEKTSVAVITNDQGSQLVDTAFTNSLHIPNREVLNGCFCCNYQEFYLAIENLHASIHPDVIFAEAVGSCADLVATIVKPMLQFHPETELFLSVFADGPALLSILEGHSSFINENVQYIYKKQLEEAGILIVNKSDLLTEDEIRKIKLILGSEYPEKKLLFQDSTDEISIKKWIDILNEKKSTIVFKSLDIDYKKYAEGEAALTWLDAFVTIHAKGKAIDKSFGFIHEILDSVSHEQLAMGHLKFFLQSGNWKHKISLVGTKREKSGYLDNKILSDRATIIVNARVEADPARLKQIFFRSIQKTESENCHVEILNLASFQPGYPRPTYRLAE